MADESTGESDDQKGNYEKSTGDHYPAQNNPKVEDTNRIDGTSEAATGPDTQPNTNIEIDEIKDFFDKKGAVEILAQLIDGPKRFKEINTAIVASHGTVSTRLTEGVKLDLLNEYFVYPDEAGKKKYYELKPAAKPLADLIEEENIRETTKQLQKVKQQHTDAVATFRDKLQKDDPLE